MRIFVYCMLIAVPGFGQAAVNDRGRQAPEQPLDKRLDVFHVRDVIMRDALSALSLTHVEHLHLGFEEIIRDNIQDDPRAQSPHFSLHLRDESVREIIDELCRSDIRYTWSMDGETVNVYPRAIADDTAYLLNLWIDKIALNNIPDPGEALTPLSKLFPDQQIGYVGSVLGGNTYAEGWTMVFERLTVRQFINRIAEHMASRTTWVWQGGKDERLFTFGKGGFQTRSK